MDKPSVYIETSIVSYLAADPSRHPVTLRNQQLTHAWWNNHRERCRLYTSRFVQDEAADGEPKMARRRLALLSGIQLLPSEGTSAEQLAEALWRGIPMPAQAYTDAMHIALASVHGMAYVLTWDGKHIANPRLQARIDRICLAWGWKKPILCTPAEFK